MAEYFDSFAYMQDMETILATTKQSYIDIEVLRASLGIKIDQWHSLNPKLRIVNCWLRITVYLVWLQAPQHSQNVVLFQTQQWR